MQNSPEAWFRIAKEDLLVAKHLLQVELYSSAAYHCQQAVEKVSRRTLVRPSYFMVAGFS